MGTIINLGVGRLELDWGKNENFINHSKLFNKTDIRKEDYFYIDDEEKFYAEKQDAYSAPLSKIKLRLDLLGYNLPGIKKIYNDYIDWHKQYNTGKVIRFNALLNVIEKIDVDAVDFCDEEKYEENGYAPGEYFRDCVLEKLDIKDRSRINDLECFYENIPPYVILRMLVENEDNLSKRLIWRYSDLLCEGWVEEDSLYEELTDKDKYLIITEGTSDLFVLKKAIDLLHPEISDFFSFIDMEDNYPFSGTGNLYKFVNGLTRINPLNKILVIFDNDAEGVEKFDKCKKLKLPKNIKIVKLPDLKSNKFLTMGPTGNKVMNINGLAVSIECFFDLKYQNGEPIIRWSSYNQNIGRYQGALEDKEKYIQIFKKNNKRDDYDLSNLGVLVDYVIGQCTSFGK